MTDLTIQGATAAPPPAPDWAALAEALRCEGWVRLDGWPEPGLRAGLAARARSLAAHQATRAAAIAWCP